MCKILAHQPNLLPPPGGGQPINAGTSVEMWTERQELGNSFLSSQGHILQLPRALGTMPRSSSAAYRSWRQGLGRGSLLCVGKNPWRRERLPNPAFWPGECHGLYSPWGCKESNTTERLSLSLQQLCGLDLACGHPWRGLWDSVGHSPQTVLGPHLTRLPWGLRAWIVRGEGLCARLIKLWQELLTGFLLVEHDL